MGSILPLHIMLFLHRIVIADFVFLLIISAIPAGHFGNFRRQPATGVAATPKLPVQAEILPSGASFCLPIPMIAPYTSAQGLFASPFLPPSAAVFRDTNMKMTSASRLDTFWCRAVFFAAILAPAVLPPLSMLGPVLADRLKGVQSGHEGPPPPTLPAWKPVSSTTSKMTIRW